MLRKRLITVLTFNNGVLFRTRNFIPDYRYTLNFVDAWSVDEVVLLDITRPGQGDRKNFYEVVEEFASKCFVPLSAGGWVKTIDEVQTLLRRGADKVIINTEAFRQPEFITEIAKLYGSQCAVVSIDAKLKTDGTYEVYIEQGRVSTGRDPASWAKEAQAAGAGEIIITSIDRDGMLEGYDTTLGKMVSETVAIPVLISGGAGNWQHFVDGFNDGRASAVCTTNIYHFPESSIKSAKLYLKQAGIDVRV